MAQAKSSPDPFYFGYPRPEVVALVPQTARRVLDIGCGEGRLGEAIKQRQQATVSGIELDPDAAAVARGRLDHVWSGDIEDLDLEIPAGCFDAIVCADVLEHLREPARLLKQIREWLALDGCIVATKLHVVHSGSDRSPAGQARKLERDMRLLLLELAERPEHPFTLFNLGMTQIHANRPADAPLLAPQPRGLPG
jgi:2-polyprenyl-3-methyl-5-hydroxy-6-metoxy-1,4-benzoquinol methylase